MYFCWNCFSSENFIVLGIPLFSENLPFSSILYNNSQFKSGKTIPPRTHVIRHVLVVLLSSSCYRKNSSMFKYVLFCSFISYNACTHYRNVLIASFRLFLSSNSHSLINHNWAISSLLFLYYINHSVVSHLSHHKCNVLAIIAGFVAVVAAADLHYRNKSIIHI